MNITTRRSLGRSDVELTALSFGAAPVGNFRYPMTNVEADRQIDNAWSAGIRYFDTAPSYGAGMSEHRLGHALSERPRDEFVVSSKVGYVLQPLRGREVDFGLWAAPGPFDQVHDYSRDGTLRSLESTLDRMLMDTIDIVFIHDVDRYTHGGRQAEVFRQAVEEAFPTLAELRDQGVVKAIGFGVNEASVCDDALSVTDPDCFLLAGRYTLLEQEPLDSLLPRCEERGVGLVLGGAFNSGVLATGAVDGAHFNYGPASVEVLDRVRALEAVCARYEVPLPAAALQFAISHPAIASVCIGSRNVSQQAQAYEWFGTRIPAEFWEDLRDVGLIRSDAPTPVVESASDGVV